VGLCLHRINGVIVTCAHDLEIVLDKIIEDPTAFSGKNIVIIETSFGRIVKDKHNVLNRKLTYAISFSRLRAIEFHIISDSPENIDRRLVLMSDEKIKELEV